MTHHADESARRAYWAEQMELGYECVQQILAQPVQECGEPMASIPDAAKAAGVEMLFSTTKIAGELDRIYFMREGLLKHLMAAGRAMNERRWILKIEDGYRSLEMQGLLVRKPELFDAILNKCIWEFGSIPPVEMVFRRSIVLIANIPKIGTHMSGSAVDISVFRRDDGQEVWRGNPYLEMSERTPMRSPFVEPEFTKNRLEITALMEAQGFIHFPFEFWHFNQGDALGNVLAKDPRPGRYGPIHWDAKTNRITPCDDPLSPLNPLPAIEREIAAAVQRAKDKA